MAQFLFFVGFSFQLPHDYFSDLASLSKMLHNNFKEMSRWDIYENEVLSGNLEWGVLHTEKFFLQNCRQLEGKDGSFMLLKRLIVLVNKPCAYDPAALQQHETFHGKDWYSWESMPLRSSEPKKALGETQLEPFQEAAGVQWA